MLGENEAVTNVETNQQDTTSAVVESPETVVSDSQDQSKSLVDEFDDVLEGQKVPYSRFSSVIKQRNEARLEMERLKKESENWAKEKQTVETQYKPLKEFSDVLSAHPLLAEKVNEVIESYARGEITRAEAKEAIGDIKQDATVNTQYDNGITAMIQENYNNKFLSVAQKDFDDPEVIRSVGAATEVYLDRAIPNWRTSYIPGIIEQAYAHVKQNLETFANYKLKGYVKEKTNESAPTVKGGSAVSVERKLNTQNDRASYIAEELKKGY